MHLGHCQSESSCKHLSGSINGQLGLLLSPCLLLMQHGAQPAFSVVAQVVLLFQWWWRKEKIIPASFISGVSRLAALLLTLLALLPAHSCVIHGEGLPLWQKNLIWRRSLWIWMGNNVVNHRHGQTYKTNMSLQINAHIKTQETKGITKNWREKERER